VEGFKIFTNDLRSPVQNGDPVWNGSLPFELPPVALDRRQSDCAAGWNFCANASTALRIAGLWPNGRLSKLFVVRADGEVLERGDKLRTAQLTIVEEIVDLKPAIVELSQAFDARFRDEMIEEQLAWRAALARTTRDETKIKKGLKAALKARGLTWKLKQYKTLRDAWDAWDAWAARAAWDVWAVWAAGAARAAWDARAARDAWAAWDARDARAARDAWAALTVFYASKMGWIEHPADLLTVGIRDAYANGLEIALPIGENTLGWA
jgi:hypothetical protein